MASVLPFNFRLLLVWQFIFLISNFATPMALSLKLLLVCAILVSSLLFIFLIFYYLIHCCCLECIVSTKSFSFQVSLVCFMPKALVCTIEDTASAVLQEIHPHQLNLGHPVESSHLSRTISQNIRSFFSPKTHSIWHSILLTLT